MNKLNQRADVLIARKEEMDMLVSKGEEGGSPDTKTAPALEAAEAAAAAGTRPPATITTSISAISSSGTAATTIPSTGSTTTTTTTTSSNITTTTTSISLLLSSGLSEQVMCQRVLTYLHRTDILQGVMKVQPLRNRFRINDFYCKEHGTKLQPEDDEENEDDDACSDKDSEEEGEKETATEELEGGEAENGYSNDEDGRKKTGGDNRPSSRVQNTNLENKNSGSGKNSNNSKDSLKGPLTLTELGAGEKDLELASDYESKDTTATPEPPNTTNTLKKLYCEDCKMKEDGGFLRCPRCEKFDTEDGIICPSCGLLGCEECAENHGEDAGNCHSCNGHPYYCGQMGCPRVYPCDWCGDSICEDCFNPIKCAICDRQVGCSNDCLESIFNGRAFRCNECNHTFCEPCSYHCDNCAGRVCLDCLSPLNCTVCNQQMGRTDRVDLDMCGKCANRFCDEGDLMVTCPDCTKIYNCGGCEKSADQTDNGCEVPLGTHWKQQTATGWELHWN